jgi:TorA maturation chaperone TorD
MLKVVLPPEERGRAGLYDLIARLLLRPDRAVIADLLDPALSESVHEGQALGRALKALIGAARRLGPEQVHAEFEALFVSAGTPPVNPYESLYLTGFLMEKPLAALRQELKRLGFARAAVSSELEDHLGALCEVMCLLIEGAEPLERQHLFFESHIAPWYMRCLEDMTSVPEADFYLKLAALIDVFFDIENQAFEIGFPDRHGTALEDA